MYNSQCAKHATWRKLWVCQNTCGICILIENPMNIRWLYFQHNSLAHQLSTYRPRALKETTHLCGEDTSIHHEGTLPQSYFNEVRSHYNPASGRPYRSRSGGTAGSYVKSQPSKQSLWAICFRESQQLGTSFISTCVYDVHIRAILKLCPILGCRHVWRRGTILGKDRRVSRIIAYNVTFQCCATYICLHFLVQFWTCQKTLSRSGSKCTSLHYFCATLISPAFTF